MTLAWCWLPCARQHGKVHFGAIYALALLSVIAMYVLLNLMSDGIDVYRVASVLG